MMRTAAIPGVRERKREGRKSVESECRVTTVTVVSGPIEEEGAAQRTV